jgi:hypothetical protein
VAARRAGACSEQGHCLASRQGGVRAPPYWFSSARRRTGGFFMKAWCQKSKPRAGLARRPARLGARVTAYKDPLSFEDLQKFRASAPSGGSCGSAAIRCGQANECPAWISKKRQSGGVPVTSSLLLKAEIGPARVIGGRRAGDIESAWTALIFFVVVDA